jgi:beta-galactosidase
MQKQSFYPWNLAYCGDIDICGWKRPQSYYRDAMWEKNKLSLFVQPPQPSFKTNPEKIEWSRWEWNDVVDSWNWKDGETVKVVAYASSGAVELFLNGRSLGSKEVVKHIAEWEVPYEKGTLTAVCGKQQSVLTTALTASRINLKTNTYGDLTYVDITLTDDKGTRDPLAENLLSFQLEGPGAIVAVGNANPMSTESCQLPQRKAWHGKAQVIVKGAFTLKAKAAGLPDAAVTIN